MGDEKMLGITARLKADFLNQHACVSLGVGYYHWETELIPSTIIADRVGKELKSQLLSSGAFRKVDVVISPEDDILVWRISIEYVMAEKEVAE